MFFLKQVPDSEKCPYSQAQTEGPSVKERGCVFVRERELETVTERVGGGGGGRDKEHQTVCMSCVVVLTEV